MDNKKIASEVLKLVGGKENVESVTHCVTRLRFVLKDESKAQKAKIEEIPGVLGVQIGSGQYQVIVGPIVDEVFKEVSRLVGSTLTDEPKKKEPFTLKGLGKQLLDILISCFVPAIPVIAGSGMIKVLAVLLNYLHLVKLDSSSYVLLNMIGDSVFYFLPIIVAYNAAKKLKVDVFLSLTLAFIMMNPTLLTLGKPNEMASFFGLGVKIINYSAQAIPIIFGVAILKYVDKFADRVSPSIVKIFLRPMISLLITAPIMLIVVGPLASYLGNGFLWLVQLMNHWGWLAVGLNAALFPIMVLTGTHNVTIPLLVQMFATQGFDSIFLPGGLAANIAEAGAAGAVAVKSKNKAIKSTAASATVSALLGITEPALYGVNLRLKRPFLAVLLGSLLGGCYIGLLKITAPTFVTPSLLTLPIFAGTIHNFILGLTSVPVVFAITFIITYLIGFEDVPEKDANQFAMPMKGELIDLTTVNDPAFASKSMGEGFAMIPKEGLLYSPVDGEVISVFPTKHAVGIKTNTGLELLIHVGIDTVNLQGEGFTAHVKDGDRVKKGQLLIEFDLQGLKAKGVDLTTMFIVTNATKENPIHFDISNKERIALEGGK